MDMSFLDVTDVDCKIGDEVTLFGEDGKGNRISGLEIGHLMGETRLAMFSPHHGKSRADLLPR